MNGYQPRCEFRVTPPQQDRGYAFPLLLIMFMIASGAYFRHQTELKILKELKEIKSTVKTNLTSKSIEINK